ncbi:poly [ADP-ribose] polymerase 1-like [Cotesia glomerata]|uniref:poly [ADP-ribose] polymerase 1-like n=1 Tax=Cotesia glomerata TaxID=32391 RepID=UPI001D004BAF|nr:poly [ADP-ribose] polymerase 1-like [Cotesia glomerata]
MMIGNVLCLVGFYTLYQFLKKIFEDQEPTVSNNNDGYSRRIPSEPDKKAYFTASQTTVDSSTSYFQSIYSVSRREPTEPERKIYSSQSQNGTLKKINPPKPEKNLRINPVSRRKQTEPERKIYSSVPGNSIVSKINPPIYKEDEGPKVNNFLAWMIDLTTVKNELSLRNIHNRSMCLSQKDFLKNIDMIPNLSVDIKYDIVRILLKSSRRQFSNKKYNSNDNNNKVQKKFLDIFYEQLKAKMVLLDKYSKRYELIKMYVVNTHSRYHYQYEIQVNYIFDVYRYEDRKKFNNNIGNKKLLWHGTKTNNVISILHNGLQLNPDIPSVHSTLMFGRGIYFTNSVSKAANYCGTCSSTRNKYGVLFLCEVALGKMKICNEAEPDIRLTHHMNSVYAIGQLTSNSKYVKTICPDVQVPCGKIIEEPSNRNNLLRHDEFVVYNQEQIKIRYVVSVSFKYNANQ